MRLPRHTLFYNPRSCVFRLEFKCALSVLLIHFSHLQVFTSVMFVQIDYLNVKTPDMIMSLVHLSCVEVTAGASDY